MMNIYSRAEWREFILKVHRNSHQILLLKNDISYKHLTVRKTITCPGTKTPSPNLTDAIVQMMELNATLNTGATFQRLWFVLMGQNQDERALRRTLNHAVWSAVCQK